MQVSEGGLIRVDKVFIGIKDGEERSTGAQFLRDSGISKQYNFDRMTTEYRFWVRCAPASSMKRSGFEFKKYAEIFQIPDECSDETRQMVDQIASMVASVLREASDARD